MPHAWFTERAIRIRSGWHTQFSQKEGRLGGLSLICLSLGIIGPFFSVLPLGPNHAGLAFGIRAAFVLLALVLGILGRRSRLGRVGLVGSAVLISVVVLVAGFLFFQPAAAPVSLPAVIQPVR
jgi:hypothetical protein